MASGWWDDDGAIAGCVAAYAPVGAADLASSYVNLVTPGTYNAAPGVAPTWDASTGWTFNGSTQYLTTGVTPAAGYSMIVRFSGASGATGCAAGGGVSPRFCIFPRYATTFRNYEYSTSQLLVAGGAVASGVMAVTAAGGYLNGVLDTAAPAAWSGTGTAISIGVRAGGSFYYTGSIQAIAIYSSTLGASDVATITTRMNALPEASGSALPILLAQHAMMG